MPPPVEKLTHREEQVLDALAEGLQDDAIGIELHMARATVHSHLRHIFAKFGSHNRTQTVGLAYREGVLHAGHHADGPVLNTNVSRST